MILSTLLLQAVTSSPLINAFIWIIVVAMIFWLCWWALGAIGVPEPFNKVIRVVLILVAVVVLINFLLRILGNPF